MAKRPLCEGAHDWVNRDSKWVCTKCPERFPCPQASCGHFDCWEERPGARCATCRKPVPLEETYVVTQGLRTKVLHQACRTDAE